MPIGGNGFNLLSPLYAYVFKLFAHMCSSCLHIYV